MPMCLLNMSVAQSGYQGLNLATTDCLCQAQPTPHPPSPHTGESNRLTTVVDSNHDTTTTTPTSTTGEMVADLKEFLQQGAHLPHHHHHHHHHHLLQGQGQIFGRPLTDQIDLLPVKIARGVSPPIPSGTLTASSMVAPASSSSYPLPVVTVSGDAGGLGTGGVMTGTVGHCACCRYNRDSGFSDDVSCDSAFQLASSSPMLASTTLGQQQQQWTGLIGGSEFGTSGQCFQCYNNNILLRGHAAMFHRPDCIQCQQWQQQQQQQQQQHPHQVPSHSDILRHHHQPPTCSHCASDSQTTKLNCGIYENTAFHQRHSNKSNNIPRIVCHSPAIGESSLKSADSGISSPTLSDTQALSGSAKPDLHHSKSLQEEDLTDHHKRCQLAMAGGHLSILQAATTNASSTPSSSLRQHRHSTGSVLESLQNKLNSIVHTPSADDLQATNNKVSAMTSSGNIVDGSGWSHQQFPPTSAAASTIGDVFVDIRSATNSPVTSHNGSGPILLRSVNAVFTTAGSNSDGSSSTRTAMSGLSLGSSSAWEGSDLSCDPWGADIWGGQRSSSPSGEDSSGDSSGGCSGSSDASWAIQFTGAAENAQDWRTLKNSQKKLSKCGFYYERMSMEQAKLMLKQLSVGSFLLRDSSNKKYLFSLSAKTPRGVTSVRIEYRNALFMLDSDEKSQSQMPGFDCVLKLIQHYVQLSEDKRTKKCVWLESSGRKDTPVMLTRPALQGVPALTHLCRKVIHRTVPMEKLAQNLKTDFTLLQYLREYPYYV